MILTLKMCKMYNYFQEQRLMSARSQNCLILNEIIFFVLLSRGSQFPFTNNLLFLITMKTVLYVILLIGLRITQSCINHYGNTMLVKHLKNILILKKYFL